MEIKSAEQAVVCPFSTIVLSEGETVRERHRQTGTQIETERHTARQAKTQ